MCHFQDRAGYIVCTQCCSHSVSLSKHKKIKFPTVSLSKYNDLKNGIHLVSYLNKSGITVKSNGVCYYCKNVFIV